MLTNIKAFDDTVFSSHNDAPLRVADYHVLFMNGFSSYTFSILKILMNSNDSNMSEEEKSELVKKIFKDIIGDMQFLLDVIQEKRNNFKIKSTFLVQDKDDYTFYLAYKRSGSDKWSADKIVFSNYTNPKSPLRMNIFKDVLVLNDLYNYYKYDTDSLLKSLEDSKQKLEGKLPVIAMKSFMQTSIMVNGINEKLVNHTMTNKEIFFRTKKTNFIKRIP